MKNLKNTFNKHPLIIIVLSLVIILSLAFLLRSRMFLYGDFYLLPDQGRDLQLVKEIYVDHKIPLIGGHAGVGGIFHGPLWIYMIVPFFFLSGGNPFFSLVPLYILVSLLIVVSGFYIGYRLYGYIAGIILGMLIAISELFITTINFTSNSQVMPLIFLWYIFCIIHYLRGSERWLIPSVALIGIGIHFESAFAVVLFFTTAVALVFKKSIPSAKIILLSSVTFIFLVSNFILFDLRHSFLMTKSVFSLLSGKVKIESYDSDKYINIVTRLQERVREFGELFIVVYYQQSQVIIYLALLILIISLGYIIHQIARQKNKEKRFHIEYLYISSIMLVAFIFYAAYPGRLMAHYVQALTLVILILLMLSVVMLLKINKYTAYIIIALYLFNQLPPALMFIQNSYITKKSYSPQSSGSYANQLMAVDYVFDDAKGKEFGYFVYDPPIVTYGTDYLIWWRGSTKYNYVPQSNKLSTVYLLMTPPADGSPKTHEYWIENVVRTNGKRVDTKVLPGDIKVIKLQVPLDDPPADPNYYINLIFR